MDKKGWIVAGIASALIPIAVVVCVFLFSGSDKSDKVVEKQPEVSVQPNGGEITKTDNDGILKFKSKYGYAVNFKDGYEVDTSGKQYDFHIGDSQRKGEVVISVAKNDGSFDGISTKDEWDEKMTEFGKCADFAVKDINGAEARVAHYYFKGNGEEIFDSILAVIEGEEYYYTYIYKAAKNITEEESNHLGAILLTFQLEK